MSVGRGLCVVTGSRSPVNLRIHKPKSIVSSQLMGPLSFQKRCCSPVPVLVNVTAYIPCGYYVSVACQCPVLHIIRNPCRNYNSVISGLDSVVCATMTKVKNTLDNLWLVAATTNEIDRLKYAVRCVLFAALISCRSRAVINNQLSTQVLL